MERPLGKCCLCIVIVCHAQRMKVYKPSLYLQLYLTSQLWFRFLCYTQFEHESPSGMAWNQIHKDEVMEMHPSLPSWKMFSLSGNLHHSEWTIWSPLLFRIASDLGDWGCPIENSTGFTRDHMKYKGIPRPSSGSGPPNTRSEPLHHGFHDSSEQWLSVLQPL